MVELSIKTIAIVLIFLVVAALAMVFIFNVYSESSEQSEAYVELTEGALEDSLTGKLVENVEKIHDVTRKIS